MIGIMGFGGTGLGLLFMLLFWIGLIALVVWAIRALFPPQRRNERDVALELVRRRYAAGEISEAEYQQAIKALG